MKKLSEITLMESKTHVMLGIYEDDGTRLTKAEILKKDEFSGVGGYIGNRIMTITKENMDEGLFHKIITNAFKTTCGINTSGMNDVEWIEGLRIVASMSREDFKKVYESDGDYLWNKYVITKDANVFDFLSYLDSGNGKKIFNYALSKMRGVK